MKKIRNILIIFLILFAAAQCYCQPIIGFDEGYTRDNARYPLQASIVNGNKVLSYTNPDTEETWHYLFNGNVSYMTIHVPPAKLIPLIVEHYDRTLVIVDDNHWKNYKAGAVIYVELIYDKNGDYYYFAYR